ncbi:MAG: 2-amino-4-hydroxy-6-hydroxymethyldihydropteridine diphosphokinase [Fusobacterium sp. JB021]|nr:2-amino-4-hydroxy-6-hydroxymethyldihydropteridine diphosphokinase [Fusobacterium sp. JB020]MDP0493650.1 2-amino-4-hydroxy-6-hydroxymethyldihydropteridine diphosphokinase [Fusobacterium sp. JB021]MDP0507182.1 2-amino-4-hydroxy-6-hydroxymethyldihydropteridine diphosphokinase [Fusobacterium sp. JB019]
MDKIIIKNLELIGNHGVFKEEKKLGQKFLISVEMKTDTSIAGKNDDLKYSTHYGMVANDIEELFLNNSFDLIETCAEKIANMILLNYKLVNEVNVNIKKPWAPIKKHFDFVGVEINRKWHKSYLSLGSNIGKKQDNLSEAIKLIKTLPNTIVTKISSFIETEPYGLKEQDNFFNTCIEIKTLFSPHELLNNLLNIEKQLGRKRTIKWGPRIIDIDIILFDDLILQDDNLAIPHPYTCDRMFVLKPLLEIAPNIIHPIEKKTISFLKNMLEKNVYNQ